MFDKNIHPKLLKCVTDMMTSHIEYSFYGEFSLYINFEATTDIPTAGVCFKNTNMHYYYNPKWIDTLTEKQVNFLHVHELAHLLSNHVKRTVGFDPKISNIAQDMIINTSIEESFSSSFVECITDPKTGKKSTWFVPLEYKGKHIFEELYAWLLEQKEKIKKPLDSASDAVDNNGKLDEDGVSPYTKQIFQEGNPNELDIHIEGDASEELKEEIVKGIVNGLKAKRGYECGHFEKFLQKITPPKKKNHLKKISTSINSVKGEFQKETITRPNRRGIVGLKGKKRFNNTINCILDVSGSMDGQLEKMLSLIFLNGYSINLIQCDTSVQSHIKINNKKELQKMGIKGYGGTILQPAIDYVSENLNNSGLVVLTDGYTDDLNFSTIKNRSIVFTCGVNPKVLGSKVSVVKLDT
jgi:predicted metal-dependent peptidase